MFWLLKNIYNFLSSRTYTNVNEKIVILCKSNFSYKYTTGGGILIGQYLRSIY